MKNLLLGLLILLGANAFAQSNTGEIKGTVTSDLDEPIPFAKVTVKVGEKIIGATTDFDGKFTIKPLDAGTYNVTVSAIMLEDQTINGVAVDPDKITFLNDIKLTSEAVVIEWEEPLIDPEDTKIETIRADQIAALPVRMDLAKIAQTLSSEISTTDDGEIYFRGARNGDVVYFIDGVKVTGNKPALPSASINAMRVYTGGVPAKYGDTMGGVIMVETKSYFDLYNKRVGDNL